jgi:hypothetical protein
MDKALTKTRESFGVLRSDMRRALNEAEIAQAGLGKSIAAGTEAEAKSHREMNEYRLYQEERRDDMKKELKQARKRANTLASTIGKMKAAKIAMKMAKTSDKSKHPHSKLPPSVQELIHNAQLDAVKAMEAADEFKLEIETLKLENATLLTELNLSRDKLAAALEQCSEAGNVTNWVNVLGKKGQRYDMYITEMGVQLMASEISACQAVYCLTVFMMKTHPDLTPGVDYRIPGESVFKEWGECIYELVCEVNRSRLDEALIIYYKHDDSPRNGYSYHGANSEAVFEDGNGVRTKQHIPLALETLSNGEHALPTPHHTSRHCSVKHAHNFWHPASTRRLASNDGRQRGRNIGGQHR